MGELFYALLFHTGYPVLLREKALQVLWLLLTTERVSRKDKVQVLLQERAMFRGLVSLVQNAEIFVSLRMLSSLLDIALLTGKSVCVQFFSHLFTFLALLHVCFFAQILLPERTPSSRFCFSLRNVTSQPDCISPKR